MEVPFLKRKISYLVPPSLLLKFKMKLLPKSKYLREST